MTGLHPPLTNLGDILRLPAHGDRVAYVDHFDAHHAKTLTAFELDDLIRAVARGLARHGVQRGDRVGILAENRVEFIASYLGIMRMGAVAVPINHRLPRSTIAHIVADSALCLVLSDSTRRPLLPLGVPVVDLD